MESKKKGRREARVDGKFTYPDSQPDWQPR
jgi:hypothetical protein